MSEIPAGLVCRHEDEDLLVLEKPAGLLCVPGRGHDKQDCLSARALLRWPDALVVHRLDQATSGLVVMARGLHSQRLLSQAFAQRQVEKRYAAVVAGRLDPRAGPVSLPAASLPTFAEQARPEPAPRRGMARPPEGRIPAEPVPAGWQVVDLPIAADWERRPLRIIDARLGKPSRTLWQAVAQETWNSHACTRVLLSPVTGRTHQLRVHMAALGHPILGDALYGDEDSSGRAPRLLLHACQLALRHPGTQELLHFESPAPF